MRTSGVKMYDKKLRNDLSSKEYLAFLHRFDLYRREHARASEGKRNLIALLASLSGLQPSFPNAYIYNPPLSIRVKLRFSSNSTSPKSNSLECSFREVVSCRLKKLFRSGHEKYDEQNAIAKCFSKLQNKPQDHIQGEERWYLF